MKLSRLSFVGALLLLAIVATSCGESSPTAPVAAATTTEAPEGELLELLTPTLNRIGLLTCRPMADDWSTEVIGPLGGTLQVGAHTLVVPRGALNRWVRITAHAPSSRNNRVEFWPHGLQFDNPAFLTMSYANCDLLGSLLPKHIAYVDDDLSILYLLQTIDNLFTRKVTGKVEHFSEYAVAW